VIGDQETRRTTHNLLACLDEDERGHHLHIVLLCECLLLIDVDLDEGEPLVELGSEFLKRFPLPVNPCVVYGGVWEVGGTWNLGPIILHGPHQVAKKSTTTTRFGSTLLRSFSNSA